MPVHRVRWNITAVSGSKDANRLTLDLQAAVARLGKHQLPRRVHVPRGVVRVGPKTPPAYGMAGRVEHRGLAGESRGLHWRARRRSRRLLRVGAPTQTNAGH